MFSERHGNCTDKGFTLARSEEMIFKLYNSGLLTDEEGKLRPAVKEKVLALLGYKDLDYHNYISYEDV